MGESEDEVENDDDEEEEEEAESCPLLSRQPPRPRNLRLGSRWAPGRFRAPQPDSPIRAVAADTSAARERIERGQQELADKLYQAYSRLSGLPIPALMRPICQWLGLRWIAKTSPVGQAQAGRFFAQAVGLAVTNLYTSLLSAKPK